MGVRFACHACQRRLNVKNELAGKKGKCPSCGTRFRIPVSDSDFSVPLDGDAATSRSEAAPSETPAEPTSTEPTAVQSPAADRQTARAQPAPQQAASEQAASEQAVSEQTVSEQPAPEPPGHEPAAPRQAGQGAPARDLSAATAASGAQQVPTPPPPPPPSTGPKDLLDAEPSALWYVRPPSGGQYGPANGRLLKEWISEGRVAAASLLWREDWAQWRRAEEVLPNLIAAREIPLGGAPSGPSDRAVATGAAGSERPPSGSRPGPTDGPAALSQEPAAAQTPPPGRVRRQRKLRRMTTIGILAGLSVLLLIVLVIVLLSGLGG